MVIAAVAMAPMTFGTQPIAIFTSLQWKRQKQRKKIWFLHCKIFDDSYRINDPKSSKLCFPMELTWINDPKSSKIIQVFDRQVLISTAERPAQ